MRSEDAERALAISSLRVKLGVATMRAQCSSLLGRLETLGPGCAAAAGRRRWAMELERYWDLEQRAAEVARQQGWSIYRTGFAKKD